MTDYYFTDRAPGVDSTPRHEVCMVYPAIRRLRRLPTGLVVAAATAVTAPSPAAHAQPRPAVIRASEGELRLLRGGTAPLLIKVDPLNTGSRQLVLATSDLPPGDSIAVHRHLREDEIILIARGTAGVQLGRDRHEAASGATVFIPRGTCIAVTNPGQDTLSIVFVFSAPGFEQVLREVSSAPGEPPKTISRDQRAAAFRRGHAEAGPGDC